MTLAMELEKQKRDGYNQGIADGETKEKISTVLSMLHEKFDYTVIAKITKLSVDKITEIAKANKLI